MQNSREIELLNQIKDLQEQIKNLKKQKKYGLVWEEKEEKIDKNLLPIFSENPNLRIEDSENKPYNLIIEGDNFYTLSVLQNTHKGKIDVIYIDPPYNTGNKDFIYNDDYVDKEDSFRHSKWLSFMEKRLKLAKNLLKDDGVIFISIDDNEFAQLKMLCDEVFGEENFISNLIWKKTENIKMDSQFISINTEYILLYKKLERKSLNKRFSDLERYNLEDEKWKYYLRKMDSKSSTYSKWMDYVIEYEWQKFYAWWSYENFLKRQDNPKVKDATWLWSKQKFEDWLENWEVIIKNWNVYNKVRYDWNAKKPYVSFFDNVSWQTWQKNLDNIFWERIFDHPKPELLIKDFLKISSKPNSIILDFFAWSGTTWHAVLELNKEDGWNRQFILCSNTEATAENPEKNICKNITYERNKRVITGYTNAKWEQIKWLGWNLRYYKTEFIPKNESLDDLRYSFIQKCDDLLCIKENTFTKVDFGKKIAELKIFKNKNNFTIILYDILYFSELKKIIENLEDKNISLYIFSQNKNMFEEEFENFENLHFANIPDEILETYQKIFGL